VKAGRIAGREAGRLKFGSVPFALKTQRRTNVKKLLLASAIVAVFVTSTAFALEWPSSQPVKGTEGPDTRYAAEQTVKGVEGPDVRLTWSDHSPRPVSGIEGPDVR
jgi:hypothetical protein